jgi:hypothetical protein
MIGHLLSISVAKYMMPLHEGRRILFEDTPVLRPWGRVHHEF